MSTRIQRITPFLWFDDQAEEAVRFYTEIFEDSRIVTTVRYSKEGAEASGRKEGTVMTIAFQLAGQDFTAINGGPVFQFSPAISLVVNCETQAEVDHYWDRLAQDGDDTAQQCGWLEDRYGVSWQVVPTLVAELMSDPDSETGRRAMQAILGMKKIDVAALRKAVA